MQVCYGMQVPFRPGTHLFKQSVFLLWQVTCKTHQGTHVCLANKNIDRVYTNMGGWALSESYLGRSKPCTLHLHQNESPILWCAESANKTIDDFYVLDQLLGHFMRAPKLLCKNSIITSFSTESGWGISATPGFAEAHLVCTFVIWQY